VGRQLASALPDVRFIAIGETLEKTTSALGQLSVAASIVGGLAVGNGLLVLLGSLATGRRQRQADAVITKVLGATRAEVLSVSIVHFVYPLEKISVIFAGDELSPSSQCGFDPH
jgi:putative ABC transport system permease protein